jgi:nucleolar protein 58
MLVLYETAAGYALFKLANKKLIQKDADEIWKSFSSKESASEAVKLKAFQKFDDAAAALNAAKCLNEDKLDETLKGFLKDKVNGEKDKLAVCSTTLGGLIKDQLSIQCAYDEGILEVFRGIRAQVGHLTGISDEESSQMKLGLAHRLARHTIKFSPDKVDTMVIQAISLLDDLDKELNTFAMRVREYYGWHFPEMTKIVADNKQYASLVLKMGVRSNANKCDFSDIADEELERAVKEAAQVSMGTEISEADVANIRALCTQVIELSDYRSSLFEYLQHRMQAIAPNLTAMVGELVGARLIAHAGSLINLAKAPASTVQILGAEKALFRALKTKHDTPKYGLLYHASLVGQAAPKHKGIISRVLAGKTALSARVDALGDEEGVTVAVEGLAKVQARLRALDGRSGRVPKAVTNQKKYEKPQEVKSYNPASDFVAPAAAVPVPAMDVDDSDSDSSDKKKKKKDKKKKKRKAEEAGLTDDNEQKKKKKKKKSSK